MPKLDEAAKRENETASKKQKHEQKIANWESPEEFRKDGGEVHPTQKVTPSQPDPENNDEYKNTRYDPSSNQNK